MPGFIADRRIWLTEDRSQVVEEGDEKAAFLLAGEGDEVPEEEAERLGLKALPTSNKEATPENKSDADEPPADEPTTGRRRGAADDKGAA